MIFKINATDVLLQLAAILELCSFLYMGNKKKKAKPVLQSAPVEIGLQWPEHQVCGCISWAGGSGLPSCSRDVFREVGTRGSPLAKESTDQL